MEYTTIHVRIPADLATELFKLAQAEDRPVSSYVRRTLASHVYDRMSRPGPEPATEAASHAVSAERQGVTQTPDGPIKPVMEQLHRQARPYSRKDSSR